jgi:putative ABC transport system permease protein
MAAVDLGFDPNRLVSAQVKIQAGTYPEPGARAAFFSSLIDEVRALPGVVSASAVSKLPIRQPWTDWPIWPSDRPRPAPGEGLSAMSRWVQPGYFETMRIPILAGRDIAPADGPNAQRIVVLSARTARTVFPDRNPIGRTVSIAFTGDEPFVVVGIVGDARVNRLTIEPDAAFYLSSAQLGATQMQLVVRGSADPLALVAPIREVLRRLDAGVVLAGPMTMTSVISEALGGYRVVILALGVFSALALALAALGLYGMLVYYVGRRANEIGIRMALGASSREVLGLIAGRGVVLVGLGLGLGLASAVPVTRLTEQLLFETAPLDAPAYASAVAVLLLAAAAACLVPARRAVRLNPVEVLRKE